MMAESGNGLGLRVTVVTVTYNSGRILPDMLASLPKAVPVLVVDNGSDDAGLVAEMTHCAGGRFVGNKANLGFGRACNLGASLAETEFVFFVNPDVTLHSDAVEELLLAADRYPSASAFNPAMDSKRGRETFRRSSVLVPGNEWMQRGWPRGDSEVVVLSGAALLVRKACFDLIGGFDRNIFLYHEDDDLSLRLRKRCGPVMFIRAARAQHSGGRSSPRTADIAALKAWHMGQSRVYVARKHDVPWAFHRALASAFLQIISPLAVLSARKRSKQIAFLKGVLGLTLKGSAPDTIATMINKPIPAGWKIRRELLRAGRQVTSMPGFFRDYFFTTLYNDHVLNRRITIIGDRESPPPKVAIYVIYPKHGILESHLAAVECIANAGYSPLIVSNLPLRKQEVKRLRSHAWQMIVRRNLGYDFGGYREGILHVRNLLPSLDRLALLNDSAWFPVPRDVHWITQAENLGVDVAGAVDFASPRRVAGDTASTFAWRRFADLRNHHYSSFALLIDERVLKDSNFLEYWRDLRLSNEKYRTVKWNEIGFTNWMIRNGYSHAATFDVSSLDHELTKLDDASLKAVHKHIVMPHERTYDGLTLRAGVSEDDFSGLSGRRSGEETKWRRDAISDILWSAAKANPAYALPAYSALLMNFGFLKKSPATWNARSADATSAVAARLVNRVGFDLQAEIDLLKNENPSWQA